MAKEIDIGAYSAYAIAVKHGYEGTEAEFAAQLMNSAANGALAQDGAERAEAAAAEAAETLASIPEDYTELAGEVGQHSEDMENNNCVNYLGRLPDIAETTKNGVTYSCTNGVWNFRGTSTNNVIIRLYDDVLPEWWLPGKTIRIMFEKTAESTNSPTIRFYKNGETLINQVNGKDGPYEYVIPEDYEMTHLQIRLQIQSGTTVSATINRLAILNTFSNTELAKSLGEAEQKIGEAEQKIGEQKTSIENAIEGNVLPIASTETSAGVTFFSNGDGTYTVNGTATGTCIYRIYSDANKLLDGVKPGMQFYVPHDSFVDYGDSSTRLYFYDESGSEIQNNEVSSSGGMIVTVPDNAVGMQFRLQIAQNKTCTNTISYPQMLPYKSLDNVQKVVLGDLNPRPMLTIIDDDGHARFKRDLLPVIASQKVPIASAVSEKFVLRGEDGNGDWMSWDDVVECFKNGAEILSHTAAHETDEFDTMQLNEIEHDYRVMKNLLSVHGINTDIVVYNGGTANYWKCRQAAKRVYEYGIYAGGDANNQYRRTNRYKIRRYSFGQDVYIGINAIDKAIADKTGWVVLMTHTSASSWGDDNVAAINAVIDYAKANGVEVVTAAYGAKCYVRGI